MKYLDVDLHKQIKFSLRSGYRRVLFVVFSIGLFGCGGGGGSDPANQPSPPVGNPDPITPPSEPQGLTLVMDTETAGAAGYAVGLSEGVVQFSQFALEHLAYATSPEQRAVQTCYKDNIEQGSVSFTHIDKNIDYRISSGDEFVLEFNDCWNEVLEASADGQFRALIKDFEPYQNHHFLLSAEISTQTFSITNPDDTNPIILSGNFFAALEVDHLVYEESITVSGLETSQSFSVNVEGITEKISEFKVSKRNQATDDTYRDSTQTGQFNILVDSEAAGGRFRCEASQLVYEGKDPFRGQAPLSADVECEGKESAVQLKDNDVLLDPNGSGEFELIGTLLWAEIIEGYWYRDATYLDNDLLQTWFSGWLPIGTFSLDWTDVAYDQYTDRLLFITSDNDPQYPRALVAYSGDTRRFVLLKTFDAEVSQIAVTAFGEQYCIAEKKEAAISCYSSDDFAEIQRSLVTFDGPFDPRFDLSEAEFDAAATVICELVADPNAPRRLAVTLTKTGLPCAHNLVLVENGQQLSESLLEMSANIGYNILLASNATVAFMNDDHSIRMYGLLLGFDGGGFSWADNVPSATYNSSRHLWNNEGRLYWGCNVWDSLTGSLLGQYEGIDCDKFYLDNTSLYGLKQADSEQSYELMIYDKESFVPQALYGNFWNPGSTKQPMRLKGTKEVLFFLEAGKTAFIDKTLLPAQETFRQPCTPKYQEETTILDCNFVDVAYSSSRNEIYALSDKSLGTNGNRLFVINALTGEVIKQIKLNTQPKALQLSGNQDYLYLLLSGSNSVSRVELETLNVSKILTIEPQSHELPELYDSDPPTILSIHSSPYRDDWIIAQLSGWHTSFLYVFQNGQLSDERLRMGADGFLSFSSANSGITGWSSSPMRPISHSLFQFFTLNQNQVASLQYHYIPMETLDDAPLLTVQDRVYSVGGTIADLTTMQLLDHQQCQTEFAGSSFSHYIDPANQRIYYMMSGYDNHIVFCAFDLQTMEQTVLDQVTIYDKDRPVVIYSFGQYRNSLVTNNGLAGFLDKYGTLYLSALE